MGTLVAAGRLTASPMWRASSAALGPILGSGTMAWVSSCLLLGFETDGALQPTRTVARTISRDARKTAGILLKGSDGSKFDIRLARLDQPPGILRLATDGSIAVA